MKIKWIASFFWLWIAVLLPAQEPVTVTTINGETYKGAQLSEVEGDVVVVKHDAGIARIALSDLSRSAQLALRIPRNLTLLKLDFVKILSDARSSLEKLDDQYRKYLQGLEDEARRSGNLERVLVLREELKQFTEHGEVDYKTFSDLKGKRQVYEDQLVKRRNKEAVLLKSKLSAYQKSISELEVSLTKKGDLEQAIKVREERARIGEVLTDQEALLALLGSPEKAKQQIETDQESDDEYYVLVASMASDAVASVNLESGEVKILHEFKEKSGPRGIAVGKSGVIYLGLRYGGMNVIALTPKDEGGFDVKDQSGRVGEFGAGKLRINEKEELFIAADAAGIVYRFSLKAGKPMGMIGADGMGNVIGLDVVEDEVYAVEVFGGRIAQMKLRNSSAKSTWVMRGIEPSLKRSTGIAVGHNGNFFVSNTESSIIPEISQKTGDMVNAFFDLKEVGLSAANDIRYVAALKNYFIMSQGEILRLDINGKLIRRYPLAPTVKGGPAIVVVNKKNLVKALADQL
ncbi:MAG: hypothetical protein QM496_10700 [Verrucomicrobiota bacterium]